MMTHICNHVRWTTSAVLLASAIVATAGCSVGDAIVTKPTTGLDVLPWRLTLNHHAIVTTKNTPIQLSYEVTNVHGQPLTGLPPVVYTTSDTSVKVDASGKLTVSAPSSLRYVWATMTDPEAGWTIADTIRVAIEDAPYTFSEYRMALVPDSVVPSNRTPQFPVRLFDANGDTVRTSGGAARAPLAYYVSTALNNVFYQSNRWITSLTPRNVGTTTVYATSHIFGQTYHDTIHLRSTLPDSVNILVHRVSYSLTPSPSVISQREITVLQNGKVNFTNQNTTKDTDIVFDDQTSVIGGNISSVPAYPGISVLFPNVGTFTYKSQSLGSDFVGKVIVVAR